MALFRNKLKIRLLGDPVLRDVSLDISFKDIKKQETQNLIDKMIIQMKADSGVGLAAPQVGISKRLFVILKGMEKNYDDIKEVPQDVFINPEIISKSGEEVLGLEGCLSLPNLYGDVSRSNKIKIKAYDRNGKYFELDLKGFLARVIQHEYDHLEGILFIDRMRDLKTLTIK